MISIRDIEQDLIQSAVQCVIHQRSASRELALVADSCSCSGLLWRRCLVVVVPASHPGDALSSPRLWPRMAHEVLRHIALYVLHNLLVEGARVGRRWESVVAPP